MYMATVNLDFVSPIDNNASNRLLNALTQAGWDYTGTSAVMLVEGDLEEALLGLEVLAKGIPVVGELGALSVQIQRIGMARPAPADRFHRQALSTILGLPAPSQGQ